MIPAHLNLKRLKQLVDIEQVLADKGLLDRLRRRGNRLVGPCPLHDGDNPNAFVVDTERNIWRCFTGCASGGDLVELARQLDDGSFAGAARLLSRLAGSAPPLRPPTSRPYRPKQFRPFTRRLALDPSTPFLARKGITSMTARRFEAGAYLGSGMLSGCVAVRLFDHCGSPLGYAGRRLDPAQAEQRGKWVLPARFPKSTLLYGYHQARQHLPRSVVVVECPWGVLRLAQLGIPAVALLGTSLSTSQRALLLRLPKILLLFDGDEAGRRATNAMPNQLPGAIPIALPDGLDPDDLPDESLFNLLTRTQRLPF